MISIVILTYNRLAALKQCLESIKKYTSCVYEIIVVDNASTDGTTGYLNKCNYINKHICNTSNEGVCARNYGFNAARYPIICQIDDDVVVHQLWDSIVINAMKDTNIGMCGVQGGIMKQLYDVQLGKTNYGCVDLLTGFFMAFRNIGIQYDKSFGAFWREDDDLCFQFKEKGYKIKLIPTVCTHLSQRREIDWNLHNKNTEHLIMKWKDKQEILRLGGN